MVALRWTPNWVDLADSSKLRDLPQVLLAAARPWSIRPVVRIGWPLPRRSIAAGGILQTLLAAAGYDTARVLALVEAAPLPVSDEGLPDADGLAQS